MNVKGKNSIYFIAGASGSGKSAIIKDLRSGLKNSAIYDFDDIGVPKDADKKWRQEATEQWLKRYLKEKNSVDIFCICGQVVLGEILACPSAELIDKIYFCFLDVSDYERMQRLKKLDISVDQNMLNWSAWLRMHHKDPQWEQHVLKEGCWNGLNFSGWDRESNWSSKVEIKLIDTTKLSIKEVAQQVVDWINNDKVELIPNTPYTIHADTENAFEIVDERLFEYNKRCVPATQKPEVIDKHFIIKDEDQIIAGIHADIYIWKILFISVIFVDEKYRNKGLGSILLNKVEEQAKAIGVKLAHLDTFDFQARDFYAKHGYEVFGILDDCPEGHKRYYMKKIFKV